MAEIFTDTAITGTSTQKRTAFNRMIAGAAAGEFELILTKEISRFARNTLDSIFYTRKLKEYGVAVLFMNDNINTMDPDAELRLTIMSSIAQEESRKTSERVKWGQKRRMEQGVVFGRSLLGYDVQNGKLYVNEQGAEAVRLIFHKFVREGKGARVIAGELREAGIKPSASMKQWSGTAVLRCLKNEKYCGDLVQRKTYTPDYLDHEKISNKGEETFITIRGHHEPIISRELFDQAQQELERRSHAGERSMRHSVRYCFSGKIRCGICGCSYILRTSKCRDGTAAARWRCSQAAKYGRPRTDSRGLRRGCGNKSVKEEDLREFLLNQVKQLEIDKEQMAESLFQSIQSVRASSGRGMGEGEQREMIKGLIEGRVWDDTFYRSILGRITVDPVHGTAALFLWEETEQDRF